MAEGGGDFVLHALSPTCASVAEAVTECDEGSGVGLVADENELTVTERGSTRLSVGKCLLDDVGE